jgi:hypothetical protein
VKKLAFLGAVAGAGLGVLLIGHPTRAADHLDAPAASTNPMADITDVFAWMSSDASKVNLVMDVSPGDDGTRHFDSSVQYVFHVTSHPGASAAVAFGAPGTESKVICTFASDTSIQCWVRGSGMTKDYVAGDPSDPAGLESADHKIKVFAGTRSDPFFFNLQGFRDAVATVDAAEAGGALPPLDAAGCPPLGAGAGPIAAKLGEGPQATAAAPCPTDNADCFVNLNVKAIVVQVDKSLLNDGSNFVLSVWGSTHAAS